ncbi:MAG: DUF6494 family protein [Pseudomonadota bacterium]
MTEDYNMSIRKFLKQVGVTSQAAIEAALREHAEDGGQRHAIKVIVVSETLGLEHEVTGEIVADA